MASPGKYSFSFQRGGTDARLFRAKSANGQPYDLTGYNLRMQVRTLDGAIGTSTTDTLVLEVAQGAGIDFTANPGEIMLALTPAQTVTLCPDNVRTQLSYGIELFDMATGEVIPLLQGKLTVSPEVVR
jgi:hypothetical protein